MIEVKSTGDPRAEKQREWLESKLDRQDAVIEYLAMMCDVEIEEEEDAQPNIED